MNEVAKMFFIIGGLCLALGFVFLFINRIPWAGRLPGDILVKKDNFTFYFPLTTSIIVSIVLSILFQIFNKR